MAKQWTNEEILNEALKYSTRGEFSKKSGSAYIIARNRGILDKACSHMRSILKQWTLEELKNEALKYETKIDFLNNSNAAYNYAHKHGFLTKICSHMVLSRKLDWNLETVHIEALKYSTKYSFQKGNISAYTYAYRNNLLDIVCSHMTVPQLDRTNEEIDAEAKKYQSRSEFQKNNNGAYQAAQARGLLDIVCSHMTSLNINWTEDKIKEIMKTFEGTRTDLKEAYPGLIGYLRSENKLKDFYKEFNLKAVSGTSKGEQEVLAFIQLYYSTATKKIFFIDKLNKETNKIDRIRRELDVYIPELSIGIEYHGLFVHSEKRKDKNYHVEKRELFESIGIKVIQIYEDEWRDKKDLVKSLLLSKLKLLSDRLYIKNLTLKKVGHSLANDFLLKNHMMGFYQGCSYIGLFNDQELVSIIGFKKHKDGIDISRFATKLNLVIPGALSKLLSEVIKIKQSKKIYYDIDLRYGSVDSYLKQGFVLKSITLGFHWTDFRSTFNRLQCRANMDNRNLKQKEYAKELNWVKIYDAGQAHLILTL